MGRKAKSASTKTEERAQTLIAAPNDKVVATSEVPAPIVETMGAGKKPTEPNAGKNRRTSKASKAKKTSAKAKKAAVVAKATKTERKKPGRKPMTAEQKAEAAKARAEAKRKAANMKPSIIVEYSGEQADANDLVERAKDAFHAERKRTLIMDLKLYVKPEERAAYYVVNERYTGKIDF